MIPRKGAEVAQITEKSLRDVLEVRRALENLAVQLACLRMSPQTLADLKAAARAFEEILGGEDVTAVAEADVAFHDVIYMATDNQRLISLLNNLREQMYRYRVEYLKKKECHKQLLWEHQEIIRAIEAGEIDVATKITEQHIDNQVEAVSDALRHLEENQFRHV